MRIYTQQMVVPGETVKLDSYVIPIDKRTKLRVMLVKNVRSGKLSTLYAIKVRDGKKEDVVVLADSSLMKIYAAAISVEKNRHSLSLNRVLGNRLVQREEFESAQSDLDHARLHSLAMEAQTESLEDTCDTSTHKLAPERPIAKKERHRPRGKRKGKARPSSLDDKPASPGALFEQPELKPPPQPRERKRRGSRPPEVVEGQVIDGGDILYDTRS